MTAGPLSTYLMDICDEVGSWLSDAPEGTVRSAQQSLREPLRVAVVGRVKAGKSTLVNALIGQRVAPTAATECTRVVTWYRHGRPAGAEVVLQSGERRPVPLIDGLPETLGVPLEEADRLEVRLPERPLTRFTLIDTPGLATLTEELADAAEAAVLGDPRSDLASRSAAGKVDAVLYVFRDIQRQDDVEFVQRFSAATGDLGASAANAIGVLSHADLFGGDPWGPDPVDAAREHAVSITQRHLGLLADVVPVAGLLAETSRTGRLTESHAAALARLAPVHDAFLKTATNAKSREKIEQTGVSEQAMRTLLRLLGPYGVKQARAVAAGAGGATAVYAWCDARAGVDRLERLIAERFTRRADALKASKALATLQQLTYDRSIPAPTRQSLMDRLEEVELDPRMHPVREQKVAEALRQRPRRDPSVLAALERFLDSDDPAAVLEADGSSADLHSLAMQRASWANHVAATASPDLELAEAGQVLSRSYLLLADRLA